MIILWSVNVLEGDYTMTNITLQKLQRRFAILIEKPIDFIRLEYRYRRNIYRHVAINGFRQSKANSNYPMGKYPLKVRHLRKSTPNFNEWIPKYQIDIVRSIFWNRRLLYAFSLSLHLLYFCNITVILQILQHHRYYK